MYISLCRPLTAIIPPSVVSNICDWSTVWVDLVSKKLSAHELNPIMEAESAAIIIVFFISVLFR